MKYEFVNSQGVFREVETKPELTLTQKALLSAVIGESDKDNSDICVTSSDLIWKGFKGEHRLRVRGLTFEEEKFILLSSHVDATKVEIRDAKGIAFAHGYEANPAPAPHMIDHERNFNRIVQGKGV